MINDFVVASYRIEKYQIALSKVALANIIALILLLPSAPLQFNAYLAKDELSKGRAVKDKATRISCAIIVANSTFITFSQFYYSVRLSSAIYRVTFFAAKAGVFRAAGYVARTAIFIFDLEPIGIDL